MWMASAVCEEKGLVSPNCRPDILTTGLGDLFVKNCGPDFMIK